MNADRKTWVTFAATLPDEGTDICERISEAIYDHYQEVPSDGITVHDVHQHDACNHTISGSIVVDGVDYGFIANAGNINGFVMREWGLAGDVGTYEPPAPTVYTVAPLDTRDWKAWQRRDAALRKPATMEMVRARNYDRHFAPGTGADRQWEQRLRALGLQIMEEGEAKAARKRAVKPPPAPKRVPLTDEDARRVAEVFGAAFGRFFR